MNTDLVLVGLATVALIALIVPFKLPRLGLGLAVMIALGGVLLMFATEPTTAAQSGCLIGHCGTVEVTSYGLDRVFGGFLLGNAAIWAVVAVIGLSRRRAEEAEDADGAAEAARS